MCPPAKIITMSAEPIASGGITPAAPPTTVHPMVRTRKNVPISSVMYLFMVVVLLETIELMLQYPLYDSRASWEFCFHVHQGLPAPRHSRPVRLQLSQDDLES